MNATHLLRECTTFASPKRRRRLAQPCFAFTGPPVFIAALGLLPLAGCALFQPGTARPSGPPKQTALRFHVAAVDPQEGYQRTADEAGQPLYVAASPLLTEADVQYASVWNNRQRSLLFLEFGPRGTAMLGQTTAGDIGKRLAIFIDDQLVASPVIARPLTQGKVYVDGEFSKTRADEIVRGLLARPIPSPGPNP